MATYRIVLVISDEEIDILKDIAEDSLDVAKDGNPFFIPCFEKEERILWGLIERIETEIQS